MKTIETIIKAFMSLTPEQKVKMIGTLQDAMPNYTSLLNEYCQKTFKQGFKITDAIDDDLKFVETIVMPDDNCFEGAASSKGAAKLLAAAKAVTFYKLNKLNTL